VKKIYFIFTILFFISCKKEQQIEKKNNQVLIEKKLNNSILLSESYNEIDNPTNEYLGSELKSIRENFKKINSIQNWDNILEKELSETTEKGVVKYYYENKVLQKFVTRNFGETFQILTEYYLLNGKLSFVFEKSYEYNRPIYYNLKSAAENNDTEKFDIEKSEIIETRNYFINGKLIHQINNQDCGSPFADDYLLEEENRIKERFTKLNNLLQKT
jgi:hypothetical protein